MRAIYTIIYCYSGFRIPVQVSGSLIIGKQFELNVWIEYLNWMFHQFKLNVWIDEMNAPNLYIADVKGWTIRKVMGGGGDREVPQKFFPRKLLIKNIYSYGF